MNRRAFVTGLGAVLAAPHAAEAHQAMKMPRIGVLLTLYFSTEDAPLAFRQGLHALGYVAARSAYSAPHLLFL